MNFKLKPLLLVFLFFSAQKIEAFDFQQIIPNLQDTVYPHVTFLNTYYAVLALVGFLGIKGVYKFQKMRQQRWQLEHYAIQNFDEIVTQSQKECAEYNLSALLNEPRPVFKETNLFLVYESFCSSPELKKKLASMLNQENAQETRLAILMGIFMGLGIYLPLVRCFAKN